MIKKLCFTICIVFTVLLSLSGCQMKQISFEQTESNLQIYKEAISKIAEEYGYEVKEKTEDEKDIEDEEGVYLNLYIDISDAEKIEISIQNSSVDNSRSGVEDFGAVYSVDTKKTKREEFDTQLFTEIVNVISGKEITKEFCDEFLAAPESEYSSSRYGYNRPDEEITKKMYALDFWENWVMYYDLYGEDYIYPEGLAELSFQGLTKASTV